MAITTMSQLLIYYVTNGFMTAAQQMQIQQARYAYENQRASIQATYFGMAAATIAQGNLFTGATIDDVINQVQVAFPGALLYAEFPVGTFTPEPP